MIDCPKCGRKFKGVTIGTHATKCGVTMKELFWHRVDKAAGPDKCWPWTASRTPVWNYGHFIHKRREYMSHRLAWELTNGPIPDHGTIMHVCDNAPCCNPAHLKLGTHDENMADMARKLRHQHGERHLKAKLTEAQVIEILANPPPKWNKGKWIGAGKELAEYAKRYGVSPTTIGHILAGRAWKHLPRRAANV